MKFTKTVSKITMIFIVFTTSCKNKIKEYYPNGNIKSEYSTINDKIDGLVKDYFENGQVSKKIFYKDGDPNGPEFIYYPSGKLKFIAKYVNGVGVGNTLSYYETGNIEGIAMVKNGVLHGVGFHFYQNGRFKDKYEIYGDSLHYIIQYEESGIPYRIFRVAQIDGPDTIYRNKTSKYTVSLSGPIDKNLQCYFLLNPKGTKNNAESKNIRLNEEGIATVNLSHNDFEIDEVQFIVLERLRGNEKIYHRAVKSITFIE